MRHATVRSNLLVPEVREVMDIRQASDYLGISPERSTNMPPRASSPPSSWATAGASSARRLDEWMDRQSELQAAEIDPHQKKPVKPAM